MKTWPTDGTLSPFVLVDDRTHTAHELAFGDVVIGRSQRNDIPVAHGSVARRHARLRVAPDGVEVIDHHSTNGTVIGGRRVDRASLFPGDQFFLGAVGFTVLLADWFTIDPPEELIVVPASGERVDRAWAKGAVGTGSDDELWAALYLRWRRQLVECATSGRAVPHDRDWPIRAIAWMCSPPVLQWIRGLLDRDDAAAWFLGTSNVAVEALLHARHGMGPLLAYDIAASHRVESRREHADQLLRRVASVQNSDVATFLFDRTPRDATSISDRIAPVFQRAQRDDSRWEVERFLDYLSRPSFNEAAESILFALADADGNVLEIFRPAEGDLLTLDDTVTPRPGELVGVARREHLTPHELTAWTEHLADFEVVQPFDQLGPS